MGFLWAFLIKRELDVPVPSRREPTTAKFARNWNWSVRVQAPTSNKTPHSSEGKLQISAKIIIRMEPSWMGRKVVSQDLSGQAQSSIQVFVPLISLLHRQSGNSQGSSNKLSMFQWSTMFWFHSIPTLKERTRTTPATKVLNTSTGTDQGLLTSPNLLRSRSKITKPNLSWPHKDWNNWPNPWLLDFLTYYHSLTLNR